MIYRVRAERSGMTTANGVSMGAASRVHGTRLGSAEQVLLG